MTAVMTSVSIAPAWVPSMRRMNTRASMNPSATRRPAARSRARTASASARSRAAASAASSGSRSRPQTLTAPEGAVSRVTRARAVAAASRLAPQTRSTA